VVTIGIGLTVGFAEVEVYPAGELVHKYVSPATAAAPIETVCPAQMAAAEPAFATGTGLIVIVTELEFVQLCELVSVTV
jgi:hypothetical protein